jgi:hypothetical protein
MNGVGRVHEKHLRHTEYVQGKKGKDSAAAQYAAATPPDGFSIQEEKPYAEVSIALLRRLSIDIVFSCGWGPILHCHQKTSPQAAHYWNSLATMKH